jgi:hypothetical protein
MRARRSPQAAPPHHLLVVCLLLLAQSAAARDPVLLGIFQPSPELFYDVVVIEGEV